MYKFFITLIITLKNTLQCGTVKLGYWNPQGVIRLLNDLIQALRIKVEN